MSVRGDKGFSLVEVVLALGIVSFSLLAVFGLLGSSLKTSSDTLGAAEALNAREVLDDDITARLGGGNFSDTYEALRAGTLADVYVFAFTNESGVVESGAYAADSDDEDWEANAAKRTGRLLRARIRVSPNFAINGVTNSVGNFTAANLPATAAAFSNSMLGVTVNVYEVPDIDSPNFDNEEPVLRYETTISR